MATKKNSKTMQQISTLAGDPNEKDINYSVAEVQRNHPYTKDKDSGNPEDQYSELISFRVDGQLMRFIEELTEILRPHYRTKSDFCRDAIFKWSMWVHDNMMGSGSSVEPLAIKIDQLSRQAWEGETRRTLTHTIGTLDNNFADLIRDGATEKIADEAASLVEKIDGIGETYWRNRAIREFVEMPSFSRILENLKKSSVYGGTPLVTVLSDWYNRKFVMRT